MAVEKKEENKYKDIKDIPVYFTLDGKKVSPTTHILLKSWDSSDIVLESAQLFIDCVFEITQRRFHLVPESNWLRNETIHSKKSNDGSRCRIPIVFGIASQIFDRFAFKYDKDKNIVKKVKYESQVYIPGVDENAIKLVDNALIIAANDNNIKQFITEINKNILQQFENAKKTVDNDTKEIALSLEKCLNL